MECILRPAGVLEQVPSGVREAEAERRGAMMAFFRRRLLLPRPVSADRCAIHYDQGFLYLVLPKAG